MARRALLTLLVGSLVAVGCRKEVRFEKMDFPGFSLEAPSTLGAQKAATSDYRTGKQQDVDVRAERAVVVQWQPGTAATAEELLSYIRAASSAITPGRAITPGPVTAINLRGHEGRRVSASLSGLAFVMVDVECGKRSVQLAAMGREGEKMMDRMTTTFDCHPTDASEEAMDAVPIGVDDPAALATFYRVADDAVYTIANDEMVVVFTPTPHQDALTSAIIAKILPTVFGAESHWESGKQVTRRDRTFHTGTLTEEGVTAPAVFTTWDCDEQGTAMMAIGRAFDPDALPRVIDVLAKVRCARPGDAPIKLGGTPPAPVE